MAKQVTVDVFVAINEDGGYEAGTDESEAMERLIDNQGGYVGRLIKIKVTASVPEIPEVDVTVPDSAGEAVTAEVG